VNRVGESDAQPHTEKDFKQNPIHKQRILMQTPLKIRQATPSDWNKILPLFKQLYHGDIGPNLQKTYQSLTKNREACVLIAEQNTKPVGALIANYYLDADWEGKIAKLQAIIVDEKHRKQGIGKKLFHSFLKHARNNGCIATTLRVNEKNKDAQLFYEKLHLTKAETQEYIIETTKKH
jgi:ribosomal protein S18 acetylase RimI-like enzyme